MASVAGGLTAPREAPRKLAIKRAELQPGRDGDQILVVVGVEHPGFIPECNLKEARVTDAHGNVFSHWYEEDATETVQLRSSYVYVFHENPHPTGKVADPRKMPYYVVCDSFSGAAVKAHVDGTPGGSS